MSILATASKGYDMLNTTANAEAKMKIERWILVVFE